MEIALAVLLLAPFQGDPPAERLPRVLLLTRSEGYEHEVARRPDAAPGTKNTGERPSLVERQLMAAGRGAFEVVPTLDASRLTAEGLSGFDGVALYTSGPLPVPPESRRALVDFVRRGGALAGLHPAVDSGEGWPELAGLLGARFDGHPWHEDVVLRVEENRHPATAFLPPAFPLRDEIYQFKDWSRSGVRVLLSLESAASGLQKGKRADRDYALAWTREEGRGRVFYTALGHRPEVWGDERFLRHVRGGILWALGGAEGGSGLLGAASDSRGVRLPLLPGLPAYRLEQGESLHPSLGAEFSVRWEGSLRILQAGTYTLTGAERILLDGAEAAGRPVPLLPGEHPLRVEARRRPGPSIVQLRWESDLFRPEPVPLAVLSHRERPPETERVLRAERGRDLAEDLNCAGCHRSAAGGLGGRKGPDLTDVGARVKPAWLRKWLADPTSLRPEATMPVRLTAPESADVAAYLMGLARRSSRSFPPDPARGRELYETVGCLACHDGEGRLSLAGLGMKMDQDALAGYLMDPLKVDPSGRMPSLGLTPEEAGAIASHLLSKQPVAAASDAAPAGDPRRGREIVASRGCTACHVLRDPALGAAPVAAPALEALDGSGKGCLAPEPAEGVPRYRVSASQRRELEAFLELHRARPGTSPAPVHEFRRTLRRLRCASCHPFEGQEPGGLKEVAPGLGQAGFKLRESWVSEVLEGGKRLRPWMGLRMPHFGAENVKPLVAGFGASVGVDPKADGAPPVPGPEQSREGVRLVGSGPGGLSCIVCHDFHGRPAGGTRGPELSTLSQRVRPDWFRRWMRDPGRIQPGTSMPAYFGSFTAAGREATIDVLWSALGGGASLPLPVGVPSPDAVRPGGASFEVAGCKVRVKDEPVVIRTALSGSSARSVAVGFPEGISAAFDAERCALRYAWSGGFLDMTPVWHERGMSQLGRPGGEIWYRLPDGPAVQPEGGADPPAVRFRGYALDEDRHPVFLYEVGGVAVRERLGALEGGTGLVRSFEIAPLPRGGRLSVGAAPGVEITAKPEAPKDGMLRLPAGREIRIELTIRPRRNP